jgi:uncharacterized protein YgiM (DUF1202 family)
VQFIFLGFIKIGMKKLLLILIFNFFVVKLIAQPELKSTSVNLNLRDKPQICNNVICVIPKSTLLSVDFSRQTSGDWIIVNYNGRIGYVYKKYLVSPKIRSAFSSNTELSSTNSSIKYYTNSKGEKVQSPTFYNEVPSGATAECRDGTFSFSRSRRGTCSHHGGVKRWL